MLKRLVFVLGVLLYLSFQASAQGTVYGAPTDKVLHFTTGFMISATTGAIVNELGVKKPHVYALCAGIAAGIIKEAIDSRPDPMDAYATIGGAFMGTIVIDLPIRKQKKKKLNTVSF